MKFSVLKNHLRHKNQEGITLLLSILILAAIMAISFSLTTILFIELRSSSDLLKSEASLYGATGIGEQALFNLKRQACSGTNCYISGFNNNVTLNGAPQPVVVNNPIINDKIQSGSTFANTQKKYELCGTNSAYDVNGNVVGCGYGKITVNYVVSNNSTDPLSIYLCEWDPNINYSGSIPCTTQSLSGQVQSYWKAPDACTGNCLQVNGSVSLTPAINTVSWLLDPTKQQEIIFTNPTGIADIYYSIISYDSDNVTPKGMPYIGSTAVNISTTNGSVSRKIQVEVPNPPVLGQSGPPFVQGVAPGYVDSNPGTNTVTFKSNVTAGNTIIALFAWNYDPAPIWLTDSLGNTYVDVAKSQNVNVSWNYLHWFVAKSVASGPNTITLHGGSYSAFGFIAEYSGLQNNPLDSYTAFLTGGYPNPSNFCGGGSVNTTSSGDVVIAFFQGHNGIGQGAGFTQRLADPYGGIMEDQVYSGTGLVSPTAYCEDPYPWNGPVGAYVASFKR